MTNCSKTKYTATTSETCIKRLRTAAIVDHSKASPTAGDSAHLQQLSQAVVQLNGKPLSLLSVIIYNVLSTLCRATSDGYINFGCSREVLFLRVFFNGKRHCARKIVLPLMRGAALGC